MSVPLRTAVPVGALCFGGGFAVGLTDMVVPGFLGGLALAVVGSALWILVGWVSVGRWLMPRTVSRHLSRYSEYSRDRPENVAKAREHARTSAQLATMVWPVALSYLLLTGLMDRLAETAPLAPEEVSARRKEAERELKEMEREIERLRIQQDAELLKNAPPEGGPVRIVLGDGSARVVGSDGRYRW